MIENNGNSLSYNNATNWLSGINQGVNVVDFFPGDFDADGQVDLIMFYRDGTEAGSIWYLKTDLVNHIFKYHYHSKWNKEGNAGLGDFASDLNMQTTDFNNDGKLDLLCNYYVVVNINNIPTTFNSLKVGLLLPKLEGYCWPLSAKVGQDIDFYISGSGNLTGNTIVDIFKLSSDDNDVDIGSPLTSFTITPTMQETPFDAHKNGCGWNSSFTVTIPNGWPSGYYAAKLVDSKGIDEYITFIVSKTTPGINKVALIANTNTWWIYNQWSGIDHSGSKYQDATNQYYSFQRPNPVTRPVPSNIFRSLLNSAELMHRTRAELWIYTWLVNNGYDPDVITDKDVHENQNNFLNNYAYLIMGTHPEYCTKEMYDNTKAFQTNGAGLNGGNLICIGGNAIFELCGLDIPNKKIIAYPGTANASTDYPSANPDYKCVSIDNDPGPSPFGINNNNFDRFDYLFQTYDFAGFTKRPVDLIGTHHNIINNVNEPPHSFTKTPDGAASIIMANVGQLLGETGYNLGYAPQYTGPNDKQGAASGRETDKYSVSDMSDPLGFPKQTESIYDNTIQILAETTNPGSSIICYAPDPQDPNKKVGFPNGHVESEIIYVPSESDDNHRGFVFTAGSITFGGSLPCDANLSTMMNNVLYHENFKIHNISCGNVNDGWIELVSEVSNTTYTLNPGNVVLANPLGLTLFTGLSANTYTITCANGSYTYTTTFTIAAPSANHCACASGIDIVNTPNTILLTQPIANDLIALYGSTISNKTFYIDDVFTVDADITFNNCTLWFTQTGSIQLVGQSDIFLVNGSVLQAACDYWLGIEADDPQQKVSIDNSTFRQMHAGILISNDAVLQATNSTFENNDIRSIKFSAMNDPTYTGKVEGNTFNGMQYECKHGIEIFNSNYINIGNVQNVNAGNTFKELNNGIDIRGDANIANIIGTSNLIGIYNNKFEDIQTNPPNQSLVDINNTVYTSPIGAGVNIDYTLAANTFSGHTTVSYTGANTSATILFDRCSKGVVSQNNNLIAEKLYMKDTWFGIMNRNMASKEVYLALNKIENTAIGTQLIGNYDNYDVIENDIILNEGIGAPYNGNPQQVLIYPAIGIDIKQLNPPYNPAETFNILTNTITIPYWAGKGIGNLGANKSQLISNNNIFFTVPNGTAVPQVPAYDPSLYGIYNSNCKEIKLDNNLVDGQYSLLNYDLTFSKAYYFETSSEMILSCNKGRATKQGFYVWGGNFCSPNNIRNNKFRFNRNPLYTLDNGAALSGSFGDIGDASTDNGNDWTFNMNGNLTWLQNQLFKVWRNSVCTTNFVHQIFTPTSLLTIPQSSSPSPPLCDYKVYSFVPLATDPCAPDPNFENAGAPNVVYNNEEIDIENAEAVALQQQTYINFVEVGAWLDNKNLYERVALDTALRNSSLILTNFYNNYSNTTISDITLADVALNTLFDFKGSNAEMISLYNTALTENSNITSNNDHELYEQTINNLALRLTRYGKDSISPIQETELEFIANLCPFVGGTAVYKARVLWGLYNPIMQYNDRLNCIQIIGQNKNGNSGYLNLDSLYEVQVDEQAGILANQIKSNEEEKRQVRPEINIGEDNTIRIYPNPASTQVTISYYSESDGYFKLYNTLGDVIVSTTLSKENSKTLILLNDIANGIYHYEIEFANMKKSIGKLSILK
ncbi:MAG: T9SS type A sorting domain-containing protein [Bacteroidetes bacterium]|nr:T9SS type A sorting domain-containing protein [Bacteroidota bacterium]